MCQGMWGTISRLRQAREPLAWWKHFLGTGFDAARPLLTPCEGVAGLSYPCPDSGVRLQIRAAENGYVAFPTGDTAEDAEDRFLTWEDVQAWKLDHAAFRRGVAGALGLTGGPADGDGEATQLAGFCERHGVRKRVYLCHADGSEAAVRLAADTARTPEAGCLVFADRHLGAEQVLKARGVALVALAECATMDAGVIKCGCAEACRALPPDISNVELKAHFDRRFDTVGHMFSDLEQENAALKQNLAQVLSNLARQVETEFFQWIYVILAAGSVNAAAQKLGIPGSTFDERLKAYVAKGGLYATLFAMVGVRAKGVGRKSIERFNEDFAAHQGAQAVAEPNVLRELLDGLEALNGSNWKTVRDELIEIVRSELPEE